ncbi:hypothetical protein SAMN05518672_1163 [Chitinophaga sp. CF118]|uniref:type II toxin-antitoxin system antitoxin SocA domain-containing protein n=1 Tax=Chitinophaga sp. CF118 TaxID=1884367 RepID=UPI0008E70BC9|nr:type II toxin-antitoxin system antitoxin SocA domain-containing protein [Chitinophaga sp. CF118]SFF09292.1 hypothetical protein SAMN05518672_1163 [Chitinophaga sp. CF118]
MSLHTKLAAFDYVVYQLTEWYSEKNGQWANNDLSRLKVIKLLFFTAAATASVHDAGLLTIFDSFAALPYGHVESEILDHMDESVVYDISRNNTMFKPGIHEYLTEDYLDNDVKNRIIHSISILKEKNPDLINMNAFDLVDLSHRYQSWITVFSLAKRNGKLSMPISCEMIMSEPKIFK